MARALTKPLDVFPFLDSLRGRFVQNRNFGWFPFGDATKNEGVGVIFGNSVVNDADVVICGLFDVLRDVGIVILPSRRLRSVKSKAQGRWWVTHIKDKVGPKALDKLVVSLGSGRNDLIPGKFGQLDCVLSNRRASAINEELYEIHERISSFDSQMFHLPRFQVQVESRHQVGVAGDC